jgi:hypothetical protein
VLGVPTYTHSGQQSDYEGVDENGDYYFTLGYGHNSSGSVDYDETKMAYIRICFKIPTAGIESVIVTIDEPIEESKETNKTYQWANTGHAFVPANYESRIVELEKLVGGGAVLHGDIDDNNIITLTGILAQGSYTFKYEKSDGTTVDIGTATI